MRLREIDGPHGHASLQLARELFGLDADPAPVEARGPRRGGGARRASGEGRGGGRGGRAAGGPEQRPLAPAPHPRSHLRAPLGSLRIGTRGSPLARAQAEQVAALLERLEGLPAVEIKIVRVSGGEEGTGGAGVPPDKRRWVDAIEQALLEERIDLAVHSAKDVPGALAPGLELIGATAREPAEDVICGASGLAELPRGRASARAVCGGPPSCAQPGRTCSCRN